MCYTGSEPMRKSCELFGCLCHGGWSSRAAGQCKLLQDSHSCPAAEPATTSAVMRTLLADPQIHVDFLTCQLASKILKHAYARIHHLISTSVKFKIGLTADPCHRWRHAAHSYCLEKPRIFQSMKLLAILEHGEAAAMLEAALIATFISHEACLNVAEGGESICKIDGPFFVYVVVSG